MIKYTEGELSIDFGPGDMNEKELEKFHTSSILEKVEQGITIPYACACMCVAPNVPGREGTIVAEFLLPTRFGSVQKLRTYVCSCFLYLS